MNQRTWKFNLQLNNETEPPWTTTADWNPGSWFFKLLGPFSSRVLLIETVRKETSATCWGGCSRRKTPMPPDNRCWKTAPKLRCRFRHENRKRFQEFVSIWVLGFPAESKRNFFLKGLQSWAQDSCCLILNCAHICKWLQSDFSPGRGIFLLERTSLCTSLKQSFSTTICHKRTATFHVAYMCSSPKVKSSKSV